MSRFGHILPRQMVLAPSLFSECIPALPLTVSSHWKLCVDDIVVVCVGSTSLWSEMAVSRCYMIISSGQQVVRRVSMKPASPRFEASMLDQRTPFKNTMHVQNLCFGDQKTLWQQILKQSSFETADRAQNVRSDHKIVRFETSKIIPKQANTYWNILIVQHTLPRHLRPKVLG